MIERLVRVKIEHLPQGLYLATSEDLPGLLAQGRTIAETVEIAADVARKLVESYIQHGDKLPESISNGLPPEFELFIPVAA